MADENEVTELPAGNQPQASGHKFRRGGFKSSDEVAAGAAPNEQEPTPEEAVAAAAEAEQNYGIDLGLPGAPVEEFEAAPEHEPAQADPEPEPEEEFRIAGKVFRTQKEAWAYAEELERQNVASEAFRAGVEMAQRGNPSEAPAAPPEEETLPPEYYANPAKYLRERDARLIAAAKAEVFDTVQKQTKHNETWSEFYNEYPDLAKAQRMVGSILQDNWERLKHVDTKIALREVATLTRKELGEIMAEKNPGQTLPKVKQATSSGTGRTVTQPKQEEKALNFVGQTKSIRTAAGRAAAKKRLGL